MAEELSQRSKRLPFHALGQRSTHHADRLSGCCASAAEGVASHQARWEQKVPHRVAEHTGVWQLRRANLC
jgi:IS1 family transposase